MTIRIALALIACVGVAACAANTAPGSASSNTPVGAPTGITSSNGGGQRQLGNLPSVGLTNGSGNVSNVPNGKGNSY